MKVVSFLARVDRRRCKGCKLCDRICPSGAIEVIDKKSSVHGEKCVACTRCSDTCPEDAIAIVPRPEPRLVRTAFEDVEEGELIRLCREAHRSPHELVCVCTGTPAAEIAAAVIQGARSIRQVCERTAVMSGCMEFCVPVVQRMLKAYGVDISRAGAPLRYEQTFSMWDLPRELGQRHPEYYFAEDVELATRYRKA